RKNPGRTELGKFRSTRVLDHEDRPMEPDYDVLRAVEDVTKRTAGTLLVFLPGAWYKSRGLHMDETKQTAKISAGRCVEKVKVGWSDTVCAPAGVKTEPEAAALVDRWLPIGLAEREVGPVLFPPDQARQKSA
ncbi:unnamed protein product, partial [Amoebophrya sp. A120]